MSLLLCVRKRLFFSVALISAVVHAPAQIASVRQGVESPISGALPGDQIYPSASVNENGGFVVWEENGTRKSGSEIRAARLSSSFDRTSNFLVNKITNGDQRNPQVQLLSSGDALFVWQGYGLGNSDIYARLMRADGVFTRGEIRLNSDSKAKGSYSKEQQSEPALSPLNEGGAMVVWQSFQQDGSMFGIYGRKISADGALAGDEFLVNTTTAYNQRSPAIATLENGNIVVVWVSEFQRFGSPRIGAVGSIDIYGRIFDAAGSPLSGEILLNSANDLCANPSVAAISSGGFSVVWSQKDLANSSNSWEIVGRSFSADGVAAGGDFKINTHTYGDQFRPKISSVGSDCAVVWTSLGQDGSREGVFGRLLQGGLQPVGEEFRANTATASKQMHSAIASSGNKFVVVWTSFVAVTGFDLFGQKFLLTQQP